MTRSIRLSVPLLLRPQLRLGKASLPPFENSQTGSPDAALD